MSTSTMHSFSVFGLLFPSILWSCVAAVALACDAAPSEIDGSEGPGAAVVDAVDAPSSALLKPIAPTSPAAPGTAARSPSTEPAPALDPQSARACAMCHGAIYQQWSGSMHSKAEDTPTVIAQTNQVARGSFAAASKPDPANVCVNCHAPTAAAQQPSTTLPIAGVALHEGVTCVSCHAWDGVPSAGSGGTKAFQLGFSKSGVFGTIANPVGSSAHASSKWSKMTDANKLCASCHDVHVDNNGDKKIEKGTDLVLQTTSREYDQYRAKGGTETCISCHMPGLTAGRAADTAKIPADQAVAAPARALHDHGFVGVDQPYGETLDPQAAARATLLRSAAKLTVEKVTLTADSISTEISVANIGAGHRLPTGFAFARQMWVEMQVLRSNGTRIGDSGVLASAADDLCDANTRDAEPKMLGFLRGCNSSDAQLTSFQQKLVDRVDVLKNAAGQALFDDLGDRRLTQHAAGIEAFLQYLPGGAVARVRPADKQVVAPLESGETRKFSYVTRGALAANDEVRVAVRLLFRPLPPYLVRALAAGRQPGEVPGLDGVVGQLKIVEMASTELKMKR